MTTAIRQQREVGLRRTVFAGYSSAPSSRVLNDGKWSKSTQKNDAPSDTFLSVSKPFHADIRDRFPQFRNPLVAQFSLANDERFEFVEILEDRQARVGNW